jgi:hypothetical protein
MKTRRFDAVMIAIALLAIVGTAAGEIVDNSTVTIIDWFESYSGYDVDYAIDLEPDRYVSDYASRGGAADTFIDFDFGETYVFQEITFTDRVTSGAGNLAWRGGLFDFNTVFGYTFSIDDDFTNGDGATDDIYIEVEAEEPPGDVLEDEIELMQTVTEIPNIGAQYLRWEVVETNGANPGANDFQFVVGVGAGVLQPGDADMDYDFDQLDLVQVQVAAKYLTGQEATWSEGDWDGGPGGEPGNPPPGDGLFNQLDVIAALNAGFYLTGPYNALRNEADPTASHIPVPEPTSLVLLSFGLAALVAFRRREVRA